MALCGPSANETQIQGATQSLAMSMQSDFQQRFAQQSSVLQNLNNSLTPIVAAGPSQAGFSAQELAAMNTSAINNAGAANKNAQQAAGNAIAGEGGGGGSGLLTGPQQAIKAGIASTSANELANTQNQITQANYQQGNANYNRAVSGEQALAGEYNPQSFGEGAQSGLGASFGEANTINTQQQAAGKAILGGVDSLLGTAGSFIAGGASNLLSGGEEAGSETGGGAEQFFSGGLNALNGG